MVEPPEHVCHATKLSPAQKLHPELRNALLIAAVSLSATGCASVANLEHYVKNLFQDETAPRTSEVNPQAPRYATGADGAESTPQQDIAQAQSAQPDTPPSMKAQPNRFIDLPAAPFIDLPAAPARPARATPQPVKQIAPTPPGTTARAPIIDFGGKPANATSAASGWSLAKVFTPKRSGFSLIASAQANEPIVSCSEDTPPGHDAGQTPAKTTATRAYLPGMNGRAWAGLVNGHLVTVSPVSVLRDGAVVAQAPKVYITRDYSRNQGEASHVLTAVARAREGEDAILYRVFIDRAEQQPIRCLDVVLPKDGSRSLGGNLVYVHGARTYTATLTLLRN